MPIYNKKSTEQRQTEFIEKAHHIYDNKYTYDRVVYVNTDTPVIIGCPIHGEFTKRPVKHISDSEGCPTCAKITRAAAAARFVSLEDVADEANKIHNFEYNYIKINSQHGYITTNDILVIRCSIHGIFEQTINKHIYQKTGCPRCFHERTGKKRTKTTKQFIRDSTRVHGKLYDYNTVNYTGAHNKVTITCPIHGPFNQTPANHLLKQQGCNLCNASSPELIIRQYLIEHNINFIHQYSPIGCVSPTTGRCFRFDFFLSTHNTLIEYDGIYHYQPINHLNDEEDALQRFAEHQTRDKIKDEYAKNKGYNLIRIPYFNKGLLWDQLDGLIPSVDFSS